MLKSHLSVGLVCGIIACGGENGTPSGAGGAPAHGSAGTAGARNAGGATSFGGTGAGGTPNGVGGSGASGAPLGGSAGVLGQGGNAGPAFGGNGAGGHAASGGVMSQGAGGRALGGAGSGSVSAGASNAGAGGVTTPACTVSVPPEFQANTSVPGANASVFKESPRFRINGSAPSSAVDTALKHLEAAHACFVDDWCFRTTGLSVKSDTGPYYKTNINIVGSLDNAAGVMRYDE